MSSLNRRSFVGMGAVALVSKTLLNSSSAHAADKKAGAGLTDKQILREGQPASIANYCENPTKQPNKFCAGAKDKPGACSNCMFYNKDNSEVTFKGQKYARCQLLSDASKPQFVAANAWCATFVAAPKA